LAKFVLVKEELPKTRLGKIKRFQLANLVEENRKGKISIDPKPQPDFEEYIVIKDYLHNLKKVEVFADDHFEMDLGMDSLDKVNFQVFLESTFGLKLKEDMHITHPTVEKLAHFMKEHKSKLT
jgi:long-chain acyl-CoA synthetase